MEETWVAVPQTEKATTGPSLRPAARGLAPSGSRAGVWSAARGAGASGVTTGRPARCGRAPRVAAPSAGPLSPGRVSSRPSAASAGPEAGRSEDPPRATRARGLSAGSRSYRVTAGAAGARRHC